MMMAAPTEMSYLWTTGGAGDGAATYTRSDWHKIAEIIGCCHGEEGVGDHENQYDATFSANTITIDTGMAMSDGKPHHCSVAGDITIPSAVGGGNTRIDRIVLRADWTAQTVRLTRIAGTDAGSPTAPAITQTSETTYDIMLYQVLVDTGGTTSLQLDERVWAAGGFAGDGLQTNTDGGIGVDVSDFAGDGLSDDGSENLDVNVDGSTIEINADTLRVKDDGIDDTKAGNRVPALTRRQGGSATIWDTEGTTDYTPTTVRMACGVKEVSGDGVQVTFAVAFSFAPVVIVSIINENSPDKVISVSNVQTTGFNCEIEGAATTLDFAWLAIGPE